MKKLLVPFYLAMGLSAFSGCASESQKKLLFNNQDLSGWKLVLKTPDADPAKTWNVKDGVIHCSGKPAGYMRTEVDYSNYHLHVEWRWPGKGGNNGVLVHMSEPDKVWPKSIECQLFANNAGDFWVIGGADFKEHREKSKRVGGRRVQKLEKSSEKPLGEWNSYDIYCEGDTIRCYVNDILQNEAHETTINQGKICLQSEGRPIEYRNIYIKSLNK